MFCHNMLCRLTMANIINKANQLFIVVEIVQISNVIYGPY